MALWLSACASGGGAGSRGNGAAVEGSGQRPDRKEILCVADPMANYIIHLTAVAGLPWPTPYGGEMIRSVGGDDLIRLRRAAPALAWDRETTGELTPFFVFLPAYLRLRDEFELEQYFIGFENAIRRDTYAPFRAAHADGHDRVAAWLFDLEAFFFERLGFYKDGFTFIRELGRLYVANYRAYEQDLWQEIEAGLDVAAADIEARSWSVDLIATWEALTGEVYEGRQFVVSLVAAPMSMAATGLSYGEILLAVHDDADAMARSVSYEFGRHLLIEVFAAAVEAAAADGTLDWTVFAAYQGLAEHYNRRVFPGYRSEIDNDVERFVAVFDQLHDQRPSASAGQLMRQGLIAFRREHM